MVSLGAVAPLLCLTLTLQTRSQHHNYRFPRPPQEDLTPLADAYSLALELQAAGRWAEAAGHLERSLRLRRLLGDAVRYCSLRCQGQDGRGTDFGANAEENASLRVLAEASCRRRCGERFPVLRLPPPGGDLLRDFSRRSPYRFLHRAYSEVRLLACWETRTGTSPCVKGANATWFQLAFGAIRLLDLA